MEISLTTPALLFPTILMLISLRELLISGDDPEDFCPTQRTKKRTV